MTEDLYLLVSILGGIYVGVFIAWIIGYALEYEFDPKHNSRMILLSPVGPLILLYRGAALMYKGIRTVLRDAFSEGDSDD